MMMAGLDGIQNKMDPGEPMDKDLYDLPPEERSEIATVCHLAGPGLGRSGRGPRVPEGGRCLQR